MPANADAYQHIVTTEVIPGIEAKRVPGFRSIALMRRPVGDPERVEFTTLMWFDDLDCVRAFAGEDYEAAYVPPAARAVLQDYDHRAAHHVVLDNRVQATAWRCRWSVPVSRPTRRLREPFLHA